LAYQDEIEQFRQLFRRLIVRPERLTALDTISRFFPASKQFPVVINSLGVPNGIVAHLKGDVDVTSSPAIEADPCFSAWNVLDMASHSRFVSASRRKEDDIPETRTTGSATISRKGWCCRPTTQSGRMQADREWRT
jgi:hypothetical protein